MHELSPDWPDYAPVVQVVSGAALIEIRIQPIP